MSSTSFTEAWISSADFSNRCQLQTAKRAAEDERLAEEIMKKIEAATVSSKLDFFRSMGLEFSNCCEINYTNNNDNNDNNNNDYDLQTNYKRPCRSSSKMSERIVERFDDKPEGSLGWVSKSKQNNSLNSKICDMTGCQKTIPLLRECRVTIIGEKCKTCGRSFKCIRDLQLHVKKKHRVKKSKKKLVIKIGDEVISRVPIKRKHLKWRQKQKQRTIDSSDDATSVWNGESCCDQISDEEVAPFVDHDRNCVTDATPWPRLMDIEDIALQSSESDVTLQSSEGSSGANPRKEEDEEIQVLLKITRPRKSITEMEINHETPNRTERERLLTDAIRDFVTMDDDLVEIIEPARDLQVYRDDSEIIEDYSHRQSGSLDGEEHNCSFHIDNADDIDCCVQDMSALLPENGNEYFQDDAASIHSPHYRNENGDIIPDFIDYTHCNNNVCEFDSLFYNDPSINMWDKPTCDPSPVRFDVHEKTSEFPDSLVLIKEEVMLDDLL